MRRNFYKLSTAFFFVLFAQTIFAQTLFVHGNVADALTGEPLIGVSVLEKGTQNGTVTDFDGNFDLTVNEGAVLLVSYIGYKDQALSAVSNMVIRMSENTEQLEELVVTGYTTQRKADLTGAVSVMDMSKPTSEGNANMLSSLQGRLAGVQVNTDAAPGSEGASIRIRGISSINGSDPLYVIDGIATNENLSSLNPSDIESIQVLKDAASASIYGSRAANGVIVITTKRAKKDRLSVNIGYSASLQTIAKKFDMLSTEQWGTVYLNAVANAGISPSVNTLKFYNVDGTPKANACNTNWQDEVYHQAWTHSVNASVASSTENSNVYFSGAYINQKGLMDQSYYNRYSARVNSDFKVGKWVKVGENLMVARWMNNGFATQSDGGIPYIAMRQHPALPVYNEDDSFANPMTLVSSDIANPVQTLYNGRDNTNENWRIFGNAYLEVNPWVKGLTLKTNIGIEHLKGLSAALGRKVQETDQNSVTRGYAQATTWTWTNTIAYNNTFENVHHLSLLAGVEAIGYKTENMYATRKGYAYETANYMVLNAGTDVQTNSGGNAEWGLFSFFAKGDYNYRDLILASFTIRRDATSRLYNENNSGWFPSASLAWRVTQLSAWPENKALTDWKIRAGWGTNGNAAIGNWYSMYNIYAYDLGNAAYDLEGTGNSTTAGVKIVSTGNKNIKWETTTQYNVGMDFAFINNSLTLSFDAYYKQTKDMLTVPPTLSVAGENAGFWQNTGNMDNYGFELQLDYHSPDYNGFTWNAGLNLSHYKNKVVKLNDGQQSIGGDIRLMTGEAMGVYYGYVCDGIFQNMEQVYNHATQTGAAPGRLMYRDINGDGTITDADQCIIGDPNPDLTLGLNLDFQYKGITLGLFFNSDLGFDIYNTTRRQLDFMSYGNEFTNRGADLINAWTPENPSATIPAVSMVDNNNEARMSTYYVEDGSYLKLKYIKLGYDLPKKALTPWHCQNLNIFFQVENVFTATKYSGLDPELPLGVYGARVDNAAYPRARSFSFGINMMF